VVAVAKKGKSATQVIEEMVVVEVCSSARREILQ